MSQVLPLELIEVHLVRVRRTASTLEALDAAEREKLRWVPPGQRRIPKWTAPARGHTEAEAARVRERLRLRAADGSSY